MRWTAVMAVGTLLGCEPLPDVEPESCRNPLPGALQIGLGDRTTGFRELPTDGEVKLARTPGQHLVAVSGRVLNLELPVGGTRRLRVELLIRKDGEVVAGTVSHMQPTGVTEDWVEFVGVRAAVVAEDTNAITTGTSEIELSVEDGCGRVLRATRRARLVQ